MHGHWGGGGGGGVCVWEEDVPLKHGSYRDNKIMIDNN